jgi:hypothetical protein
MPSYPPLDDTHDEDEDEYDYEDEDEDERMSILDLPSTVLYDIFVLVQVNMKVLHYLNRPSDSRTRYPNLISDLNMICVTLR